MAKYQKGDTILDEAVVGTKTPEDWASQGFKPLSSGIQTGVTDLGGTKANISIEPKGALTDIQPMPKQDENLAGAGERFGINLTPETPAQPNVSDDLQKNVFSSAQKLGNKALANKEYVNAVFKAYGGRDANQAELLEFTGKGVQDVFDAITTGLSGKKAEVKGGTGTQAGQTGAQTGTGQTGANTEQPQSTGNPIQDQLMTMFGDISDQIQDMITDKTEAEARVAELSPEVNALKGALDQMKNSIDYDRLLATISNAEAKMEFYNERDEILSVPKLSALANAELARAAERTNIELNKEGLARAVADATNVYKYNSKLIEYSVAVGDLQNAQQLAQKSADNIFQYQNQMLNIMQFQNQITQQDRAYKQAEIDREYDMALQGYAYVESPSALQQLAVDKGLDWVKENTIKIGGKIYVKPQEGIAQIIEMAGKRVGIDKFGNPVKDFGAVPDKFEFKETADGNFVFNPSTGSIQNIDTSQTAENGIISVVDGNGNTQAYDISVYATDPNHENAVAQILNKMGTLGSIEEVDSYIQKVAPGSRITGQMIANASAQYGVAWEPLIAMMQQDSSLGTKGLGATNNNPGNIGQFDSLGSNAVAGYSTMQEGVNAVAKWLANHRTVKGKSEVQELAESILAPGSTMKLSDISTKDNLRGKVGEELNRMKELALADGNVEGIIKASAGGQAVGDSFIQSFEKALNVLGQLEELQTNISDEKTGPILGIIRSNNPYDVKAQQIGAQLNAIVPNLARGIYGEVGVLTDNDIRVYASTLPNLKSTADVRNAILSITLKSVQRSLENKIVTQAGFGRDVSGILDTYTTIQQTADGILAGLEQGGGQTSSNNLDLSQFEQ